MNDDLKELLEHCWKVKTKFDKKGSPTELQVTFKVSAAPGHDFQQEVEEQIGEFLIATKERNK